MYTHLCGTTLPFDYAQYETNNVRNELITSAFFSMCVCHFPQFYIAFCGLFITNSSQSVDEITPKSQFFEKKFDMKIEIQFDAIQNEEFLLHFAVLNNSKL